MVSPEDLREPLIYSHHLTYYSGHFGYHKTVQRLAQRSWWSSLNRDVKRFLRSCPLCLSHNSVGGKYRWLKLPICTPFEVVAMDIIRPLLKTRKGNEYILVLIEHHTRWVELSPLRNTTIQRITDVNFKTWISRWGEIRFLLSDNQLVSSALNQETV